MVLEYGLFSNKSLWWVWIGVWVMGFKHCVVYTSQRVAPPAAVVATAAEGTHT